MKPANTKRAVTVGIFIFLGLAILVAGVLTLGGQQKTFEKKIKVKAIFEDVGGLQGVFQEKSKGRSQRSKGVK